MNSAHRALDPRRSNIGIDANALDRHGTANDQLVDRFERLSSTLTIVVGGGVRDEVLHPRTPGDVKAAVLSKIFNLRPGSDSTQLAERRRIHAILQAMQSPTSTQPTPIAQDAKPRLSEVLARDLGGALQRNLVDVADGVLNRPPVHASLIDVGLTVTARTNAEAGHVGIPHDVLDARRIALERRDTAHVEFDSLWVARG